MIEVMLVTGEPVVCEGLRVMLQSEGEACLVRSYASLTELMRDESDDGSPVVMVHIDSALNLGELRELCKRRGYRVCLFARNIAPELLFQAREAGVSSILATCRPAHEIITVICDIAEGQFYYDPLLAEGQEESRSIHLTPREGHLVELLTQGLKNKEIAFQLGITEGTVKVYLSKLYQKVGARDRFDMALYGLRNHGITSFSGAAEPSTMSCSNGQALRTLLRRIGPIRERRSTERAVVG